MAIDLKVYSAACILLGVQPPINNVHHMWYELHWTSANWNAFIEVNRAFNTFNTEYAEDNPNAGKHSGWLPVPYDTFK